MKILSINIEVINFEIFIKYFYQDFINKGIKYDK